MARLSAFASSLTVISGALVGRTSASAIASLCPIRPAEATWRARTAPNLWHRASKTRRRPGATSGAHALLTPRCRSLNALARYRGRGGIPGFRRARTIDEMRTAGTRMRSAFGQGGILASVGVLAALAALIVAFSADVALAQNAECARLQQAIAARRGSSGSQGAVERQRAELSRTSAYARSLGCENRKFLFFGSEPPAQCGELNGQISRMQANLADLQARAGGGAGDLIARYNAECGRAPQSGPGNVFEALFGGLARLGNPQDQEPQTDARFEDHGDQPRQSAPSGEKGGVQAHSGSYAVCVRTCDGSFFPVSYSRSEER